MHIPLHLSRERFRAGFRHALKGGQITPVEDLRLSFREGFGVGKPYLRELGYTHGILKPRFKGEVKLTATF